MTMKKLGRLMLTGSLLGLLALVAVRPAEASFLTAWVSVTPNGPNYDHTYDVTFDNGFGTETLSGVAGQNFATIYDIEGFVGASTSDPNFVVSVQNLGIDGFLTMPADSVLLPNVTFSYVGPAVAATTNFGQNFVITSTHSLTKQGFFTGQTNRPGFTPPLAGNISFAMVPAVPEPGSMALVGIGLVSLLGLRWRRKLAPAVA